MKIEDKLKVIISALSLDIERECGKAILPELNGFFDGRRSIANQVSKWLTEIIIEEQKEQDEK